MGRVTERYVQDLGLSVGQTAEGFTVMDLNGTSHHLNNSALFILECCAVPRTVAEVTAELRSAFALEEEPIDLVEACLADLAAARLLRDADSVPATPALQPSSPTLEVRVTPGVGRGVFARVAFEPGAVVDRGPVVVVPAEQWDALSSTVLGRYAFEWEGTGAAVVLGLISLVNHSERANTRFRMLEHERVCELVALEPIAAGDELSQDYTGGGQFSLGYAPIPLR